MTWFAARRKAIAGLVAVLLAWGPAAQAAHFDAAAWWALAMGLAGVLGIHAAPNDITEEPSAWSPPTKDAGQGGLWTVVAVLAIVALGIWILAALGHPV